MQRFIPIKFSVRGRDLGGTVAEAQARIAKNVKLPSGYRMVWSGEFGDLQEAKKRLAIIVPISLLLILGLLYCLFNSLRECLLALAGIPFAIAGGVLALYVSGSELQHLRRHRLHLAVRRVGHERHSADHLLQPGQLRGGTPAGAMFHAASTRMRPLLMTSLSACIGLFPAAISTGIGSQVQRPLATVIVGGMFVGPIMLLIVVPALKMMLLGRGEHGEPAPAPTVETT